MFQNGNSMQQTRRSFLRATAAAGVLAAWDARFARAAEDDTSSRMRLGLVTYNWGKDWDVPTLIENCAATGFEGVETRTTHKHGIELSLTAEQRREVRKRFEDSPVQFVGIGSACEYHSPDPAVLAQNIEETKAFVKLCHDLGGSGVKVRPNALPKEVPAEKTLEQIGKAFDECAKFGADYGIVLRMEVHGRETAELPNIRTMLDHAPHPGATVCWNCNPQDLNGEGLEANFKLVQDRINTIHIHDLRMNDYPWEELFALLRGINFRGWTLLEDGRVPEDIPAAMKENVPIWKKLAGV